ncbi:uncharacterized protein SPSK_02045 [Sporothrix schenckii 1099-18]|uniref:Uncharacterized protein n=1 Tax=Sporothrix schenckii 1099-18 TaxID=1397361 RepID=A0A0F2MH46_SPOSC|nr:uncharacterized protein SPSK_02045 [Sporothrix schenckii 1099-18]KJR87481.1 hypothetical protein SPSK_02045 [Sporothrix schenckii 1099-18]
MPTNSARLPKPPRDDSAKQCLPKLAAGHGPADAVSDEPGTANRSRTTTVADQHHSQHGKKTGTDDSRADDSRTDGLRTMRTSLSSLTCLLVCQTRPLTRLREHSPTVTDDNPGQDQQSACFRPV